MSPGSAHIKKKRTNRRSELKMVALMRVKFHLSTLKRTLKMAKGPWSSSKSRKRLRKSHLSFYKVPLMHMSWQKRQLQSKMKKLVLINPSLWLTDHLKSEYRQLKWLNNKSLFLISVLEISRIHQKKRIMKIWPVLISPHLKQAIKSSQTIR